MTDTEKLLPARYLIERYSVTDRTLDRWLEQGILPAPVRINNRRYWRSSEIEQAERDGMRRKPRTAERHERGPPD